MLKGTMLESERKALAGHGIEPSDSSDPQISMCASPLCPAGVTNPVLHPRQAWEAKPDVARRR